MKKAIHTRSSDAAPRHICILAFDGISPFHLSAPCLVLGEGLRSQDVAPFKLQVCAWQKGPLRTSAGFHIEATAGLHALRHADVIIVPSWHQPEVTPPDVLLNALRSAHARGALIVGLCLGAFVVAAAGLLNGKTATTHWHWAAHFTRMFPALHFDPDVLYVDEGSVVTSAGTAASLDCCLHLLRRWYGAEVANRVARRLVLAPHRAGGQAQFVDQPLPVAASDERIQQLLSWVQAHLDESHSIDSLAARAAMSRRSFTRNFQRATGTSVLQWLLHQRLALAARLLEGTALSMEAVAAQTGFQSAMNLRLRFKAGYGLAPTAYRQQFQP